MGACAWAGAGPNDQPSASAPARLQSKMDIGILLEVARDGSWSAEISLVFSKLGRTCQGAERAPAADYFSEVKVKARMMCRCAITKTTSTTAVLDGARGKDILLGVIDVGAEEVEAPALVASRIRKALPYVDPARLFPCTDCGLVPRTRAAARAKLSALVEGTRIVRRELGR